MAVPPRAGMGESSWVVVGRQGEERTMRRALATLTALASLAALSLTTPPPASAQPAKAGVVTALLGTATVVRASTKESLPLKFRDAVFLQDRVTTGDNSVARILLGGQA